LLAGDFYRDIPREGIFRVEVRARGLHTTWRSPQIGVQIIDKNEQVLVQSDVLFALMPKGPLGSVDALQRKRFIVDQTYFPDMRLSSLDEAQPPSSQLINLSAQTVDQSNWLPGTLERIFRLRAQDKQRKVAEIAIKEQIAAQLHVHPAFVNVAFSGDQANAVCSYAPLQRFDMSIQQKGEDVVIGPVATVLHMEGVRTFWQNKLKNTFGLPSASGFQIDVFYELTRRFVGNLRFDDPEFINRSNEKGCLFVANHQVAVESMTFSILLSAMQGKVINMIAKKEHKDSWMGKLLFILGERSSLFEDMLTLINREDSQDVFSKFSQALEQVRAGHCSMLVHVNGTRSLQAREPVSIASTALLGAAISAGVDIVPVSFRGGLPLLPLSKKLEFPIAYGKQDILVGKALAADQLSKLSAVEQKQVVLEAINGLQPALEKEMPGPSDSSFSDAVSQAMSRFDGNEVAAVLWVVLSSAEARLSDETALILQMLELGGQPDEDQLENESIWQIAQEIFKARHKA
jgi:1-acyl-sn-glycerol-3-phosphate acyltransferase